MTSEVTQAALEPCPFCGGMASEETSKGPTGERYRWVQCEKCGAMSECCDDSARANNPDEPEPVLLWNTRLTAQSGEGRSGAGEDAAVSPGQTPPFLNAPTFDDRSEERVCINGCLYLRADFAARKFAALDARQSGEGEREAKAIARFADAIGRLPFVSEALAKGYQFNAYESALNDDDAEDDEREYQILIGPVSDLRFICAIEGMAKADLIEAALKIAALRATDDAGGAE